MFNKKYIQNKTKKRLLIHWPTKTKWRTCVSICTVLSAYLPCVIVPPPEPSSVHWRRDWIIFLLYNTNYHILSLFFAWPFVILLSTCNFPLRPIYLSKARRENRALNIGFRRNRATTSLRNFSTFGQRDMLVQPANRLIPFPDFTRT